MRLALYSDQRPPLTDPIDDVLATWLPKGARVGHVPSAPDPDRRWFRGREAYYRRLGMTTTYFGLEEETGDLEELLQCDAIHLTGGNTFQFLFWLRERGWIEPLKKFALNGGVLIGVSAGAILMTPEIGTSLLCGDVPYRGIQGGAGLSLVDFAFVPHFEEGMLEGLNRFAGTVYAVKDGGAVVVVGEKLLTFGEVLKK